MKTAREILLKHAWASVDKHDYLPTTDKEASEFIPHNWATKAVEEALEISQKESAQKLHSEIHKLSNIMEREFGDRVGRYFQSTGEDRQEYAAEVKRLRAAWHTLAGETPEKDKRMEMTQDNFYRVIAMNDELIHQQKDEIAKLKQTVNKLRMKGE